MRNADILVVGLGAMGSAALYHLARRGVPAVGIEQFQLGHALGSSHGFSRIFREIYHDPFYVELAGATIPLWQELDSLAAEKLMHFTGLLYFSRPGNINIEQKVEAMEALKRPIERPTPPGGCLPATLHCVCPRIPLPASPPRPAFLTVGRCILEHLHQAQRAGATIHEQVRGPPRRHKPGNTAAGDFRRPISLRQVDHFARPLGTPKSSRIFRFRYTVTRQQEFYFRPQNRAPYQPGGLPVFGDMDTKFYGFPDYGPGVKTADDGLGVETSPGQVDRELDMGKRDDLQEWLETIMPDAGFTYVEGATCMYTNTPDRDFIIGAHPGNPNVLVAAGFSGHGFKFSTLVGKILSDLAAEGATEYPIDRFRPDRFEKAGNP